MHLTTRRPRRSSAHALAVTAVTASLLLTACGGGGGDSAASGDAGAPAEAAPKNAEPIEGRPTPVENTTGEEVKISMVGFSNNPYWVSVQQGVDYANSVLAAQDASAEWVVAGATIDVQTVNSAIQAAANQDSQGVGFFIAGEGNCQTVEDLAASGTALGAYNTLFPCMEEAGGVINYAQDQVAAGRVAAEEMIKATGGEPGSVGIIVSQFTAPGSEQRRKGFIEGLEGSNLTVVGEGVEAQDSASNTFSAAQNYLQSTDDLVGIYATAGGPFGAAQAVAAAGKQDTVKVIGYDITAENVEALRDGSMYGVIGQDAFGQGYNVAIELYNSIVSGDEPAEVLQPAESPFVTADNLDEHDPEKLPVGTLGAS